MATKRTYAGLSAVDRQMDRRRRLIEAAIALYGSSGYRNTSVRAICLHARLTERHFYESFGNSESLLTAAFEASVANLLALMAPVGTDARDPPEQRVRALLGAYYRGISEKPVAARVFLRETTGISPALDTLFDASLIRLTAPLAAIFEGPCPTPSRDDRLRYRGVAGSLLLIATGWIDEGFATPLDDIVEAGLPFAMLMRR